MVNPGTPIGPFGRLIESETAYRTNPAVSNSDNNLFLRNEALFRDTKILKQYERPDSDALKFGRAFHCFVLEEKEFHNRYTVFPGKVRRGKEWDAFEAANQDKEILSNKEHKQITDMAESMTWNKEACVLLDECDTEVVFRHNYGGMARQCRVDGVSSFGTVIDLKSCESIEDFKSHFQWYGYHRQAWWYSDLVARVMGIDVPDFVFIAVEKSAPYRCEMFQADADYLLKARDEIADGMDRLGKCLGSNDWRRNADGIQTLTPRGRAA